MADPSQIDDRRARLEAIRDTLTTHLADAPTAYVAPVSRQLAAILKELDELPGSVEVTPLDELRAARAARREGAANPDTPGRRGQQRRRGRVQAS